MTTHIRNCLKCIAFSPNSGKVERKLHYDAAVCVPFDTIHVDHAEPMDKTILVKKYVFVVVDSFTKFVKLYANKTTASKEAIVCLKQYFSYYSKPKVIVSDRGTAFTSTEFSEFLDDFSVKHVKIATGSPQAKGQVERVNRVLKGMLSKLSDNDVGKSWYKLLDEAEYAINNTISKTTGETPSKLLFGIDQRGKTVDEINEFLKENVNVAVRNLGEMREKARSRIDKSREYNKAQYDKKHKDMYKYQIGDWVMIRNFDSTAGVSYKLIPQFKGPYQVIKELRNDRYVIADVEGFQMTQKPYQGVWEPANMRLWKAPAAERRIYDPSDEFE